MPIKQHFFIEGKYFGFGLRAPASIHAKLCAPRSFAFFCPCCAEVWARCQVEIAEVGAVAATTQENYLVWTVHCRKHPVSRWQVAGALTLPFETPFTSGFPEGVLQWELARHLDHAEKYNIDLENLERIEDDIYSDYDGGDCDNRDRDRDSTSL